MRPTAWVAILFTLSLMSLSSASAATIHVMQGATCPNHSAVLGAACSSSSSCGSPATPCCTLQAADNKRLSRGDVVELHDHTWTYTSAASWSTCVAYGSAPNCCGGSPCCSSNSLAAYLQSDGITVRAAAGDNAVLDLNSTLLGGICVAGDDINLDGFSVLNKKADAKRNAVIQWSNGNPSYSAYPPPTGGNLTNMKLSVAAGAPSGNGDPCIKISYSSGHIIEDNTCTGNLSNGFYLDHYGEGNSAPNNHDLGLIIRRNTMTRTTASGSFSFTPLNLRHGGRATGSKAPTVIYDNVFDGGNFGAEVRSVYARENKGPLYVFNNIWLNSRTKALNFQDNGPSNPQGCDAGVTPAMYSIEDHYWFNNTWVGTGSAAYSIEWPLFLSTVRFKNNIFSNHGGISYSAPPGNCSACPSDGCWGYGWPQSNSGGCCTAGYRDCNSGVCEDGHVDGVTDVIRSSADLFVNNNCYNTDCSPPSSNSPTFSGTVTGNPSLTSQGRIQGSSTSILGAGSNDPIGQGANNCSITVGSIGVVDCTLDIDGEPRGTSWDIGADELGSGGSPPNQPNVTSVDGVADTSAVIHGSGFSDPDAGDTLAAGDWQVDYAAGNFSSPVDSGSTGSGVTQWTASGLIPGTAYTSRLRYRDSTGAWSSWSNAAASFSTTGTAPALEAPANVHRTDQPPPP